MLRCNLSTLNGLLLLCSCMWSSRMAIVPPASRPPISRPASATVPVTTRQNCARTNEVRLHARCILPSQLKDGATVGVLLDFFPEVVGKNVGMRLIIGALVGQELQDLGQICHPNFLCVLPICRCGIPHSPSAANCEQDTYVLR